MRRVLITGASGFIGGRLAEVLNDRGIATVALVRTWSQAARLSRLPLEMLHGDVLDPDSLRAAGKGCDVIFHCAVDWRGGGRANRRSSARGTLNVLQAAREAGVTRVVALSSVAVFGPRPNRGVLTEADPTPHTGDDYGDGKIDLEAVALRRFKEDGLPVTILRPTIVYGPFGRSWTINTCAMIREKRMALINGGAGVCNALYVDNLTDAMLLAAEHPAAPGEVFHISDAPPITWKAFIEGHASALGEDLLPLPEFAAEEIEELRAKAGPRGGSSLKQALRLLADRHTREAIRAIPIVSRMEMAARGIATRVLPEGMQRRLRQRVADMMSRTAPADADGPPPPLLPRSLVRLYADTTVYSTDKARRLLGFEPKIGFGEGMELTAAWIRWARL